MKRKIATVPRLVEGKGDWYVYYSVRNPLTGKMVPKKVYQGLKECKTIAHKRAWGKQLVQELTEKLKAGWSPLDDKDNNIYLDETEYQNFAEHFAQAKSSVKNVRFYITEYLLSRKAGLKKKSYSTYTSKLRIFTNWMDKNKYGDYDVSAVDEKIIRKFFTFLIDEKDLDRGTIEKYVQILRDFFGYLKKHKKLLNNPVGDIVKPPKHKDMGARPIPERDLKALLTHVRDANPQLYLACMFQYYLAIRPGNELRLLKVKDIDTYNNKVVVIDESAKVSRRTIDMPEHLAELCSLYQIEHYNKDYYVFGRNGIPGPEALGMNTLRNRFNKYRDALGMPDIYKFYSLKHTGGGKLLDAGITLEEIRNHFGHKSIETTDRYVKRHFGNRNVRIIKEFPRPD